MLGAQGMKDLTTLLEQIFSRESISKNYDLVDFIYSNKIISVTHIATLRQIRNTGASYNDIRKALKSSTILNSFTIEGNQITGIQPPCDIVYNRLIVNGADPKIVTLSDFEKFVIAMTGKKQIIKSNASRFQIDFDSYESCITFWRSLRYIKFNNCTFQGSISTKDIDRKTSIPHSKSVGSFKKNQSNQRTPNPQRTKIQIEKKSVGRLQLDFGSTRNPHVVVV